MASDVRAKIEEYFSSMNPTAKRLMADLSDAKQQFIGDWESLCLEDQEDALWNALVKPDVADKYEKSSDTLEIECFPVLRIKPGGKIVVDEEASTGKPFGATWRDEHSAPFRWETQSQLNLTFCENTLKKEKQYKSVPAAIGATDTLKDEKKDEETKRPSTIKRPEVPPPPVPPHAPTPPVPPHNEAHPPVPPHNPAAKSDTPVYAKVVKRKSFNAKTLVMSEMKAHKRAMEEMKPAVPPRMSLELQIDIRPNKDGTIDMEAIPKTGFDFLDNW